MNTIKSQLNTTVTPPPPAVCPGCGRCNTCGRGPEPVRVIPPYQPIPYIPWTPSPYIPWSPAPYPWYTTSSGTVDSGQSFGVTVSPQGITVDSGGTLAFS